MCTFVCGAFESVYRSECGLLFAPKGKQTNGHFVFRDSGSGSREGAFLFGFIAVARVASKWRRNQKYRYFKIIEKFFKN